MRSVLLFAIAALAIAAFVPKLYLNGGRASAVTTAAPGPQPPTGERTLTLSRGANGHFQAEAVINGRRVDFLVDTGASLVVLRERDAGRLGFHPARRDYTAKVATANGTVLAARLDLNRIEVGGLTAYNVAALVLPNEALSQNLLGMSFLSRLRWEHRNGKLVLQQ